MRAFLSISEIIRISTQPSAPKPVANATFGPNSRRAQRSTASGDSGSSWSEIDFCFSVVCLEVRFRSGSSGDSLHVAAWLKLFTEFLLTTDKILPLNHLLFQTAHAEIHAATAATTTSSKWKEFCLHVRSTTLGKVSPIYQVNSVYDQLNRIKYLLSWSL